jgi:glycosyltransferase involved in cell wall biosynthesis
MRDFDSARDFKWTGRGIRVGEDRTIHLNPRGIAEHSARIPSAGRVKIIGRRRSGNGLARLQVLSVDDIILLDEKISLSTTSWSETSFPISCPESFFGKIRVTRLGGAIGGIEIGRVTISSDKVAPIKKREKSPKYGMKRTDLEMLSRFGSAEPSTVAIIVPYGIYGGAEIYIKNILDNIDSRMLDIELLYLGKNPLSSACENRTIKHTRVGGVARLGALMVSRDYDVVVYYNSRKIYDKISELATNGSISSRVIEIYHSNFEWSDSVSSLPRRTGVDEIFRISSSLCSGLDGIKEDKITTIPVGIDLARFCNRDGRAFRVQNNLPVNKPIVGVVSRLSPEKNIGRVLEIAKKMKDFTFLIIGSGPEASRLGKMAGDNVKFLGYKSNIYKYYSLFDAFLSTSAMEGTPISMLEAMASGVPVFMPKVGGIPDVISNGDNGFFIGSDDSEVAMLISENIENINVINSAMKYVRENHDIKDISLKFLSGVLPDSMFYRENNGDSEILIGKYV